MKIATRQFLLTLAALIAATGSASAQVMLAGYGQPYAPAYAQPNMGAYLPAAAYPQQNMTAPMAPAAYPQQNVAAYAPQTAYAQPNVGAYLQQPVYMQPNMAGYAMPYAYPQQNFAGNSPPIRGGVQPTTQNQMKVAMATAATPNQLSMPLANNQYTLPAPAGQYPAAGGVPAMQAPMQPMMMQQPALQQQPAMQAVPQANNGAQTQRPPANNVQQIPTPPPMNGMAAPGPNGHAMPYQHGGPGFTFANFFPGAPFWDEPPAYPVSSGTWWRNGCWYGALDVAVWHHSRPREGNLAVDASPGATGTLDAAGAPLGVEPGARVTLGYIYCRDLDNRDHSVECTYLGFNNWHAVDGLDSEDPNGLRVPTAPDFGGFNFADIYSTNYRSSLQSLEFNYRLRNRPGRDRMIMGPDGFWSRQITPGRTQSLVLGFRGLSVDEHYEWLSTRVDVAPDVFSGDMTIHGDNTLIGFQIGGDCIDVHANWWWGVIGKAGVYVNFSRGSLDLVVNDPQDPEDPIHNRAHDQSGSFFGELSFAAGYNLTKNIAFRASADLALISNIMIAPENVSFDQHLAASTPSMNIDGQIFYIGTSIGFEAYW